MSSLAASTVPPPAAASHCHRRRRSSHSYSLFCCSCFCRRFALHFLRVIVVVVVAVVGRCCVTAPNASEFAERPLCSAPLRRIRSAVCICCASLRVCVKLFWLTDLVIPRKFMWTKYSDVYSDMCALVNYFVIIRQTCILLKHHPKEVESEAVDNQRVGLRKLWVSSLDLKF